MRSAGQAAENKKRSMPFEREAKQKSDTLREVGHGEFGYHPELQDHCGVFKLGDINGGWPGAPSPAAEAVQLIGEDARIVSDLSQVANDRAGGETIPGQVLQQQAIPMKHGAASIVR